MMLWGATVTALGADAHGVAAGPEGVEPWPVSFVRYWPGTSLSVAGATHGALGMPPWSREIMLRTLVAAKTPPAVRFLPIALAVAQRCLPVLLIPTLSGV